MTCRTTHHAGCACHEARHAEEIARLRARVETAERERDIALADDAMHFAALRHLDDVHAKVRGERDALRDAAREYLDAEARGLTHSDLATWRASNAARTRLAALVGGAP